jgi:hypothetical protein
MEPFGCLEMLDYFEEISGLRVAAWTQHAHQALRRSFGTPTQLFEPDRRVNVIAQDRFSRIQIAGKKAFDAFPQKRFPIFAIRTKARLHAFLELPGQRHFHFSCALRFL